MQLLNREFYNTSVTLRVTALWAFSESFMGGILHGLKLPFAGLFLSFVASVCITLLASGSNQKGAILKATLLVIAVKFILSPHTPPMAYVAVLIQGLAGELFFLTKKFKKAAAFTLTVFSLLYSAFQQLIILTVIFGNGFWKALDVFFNKISQIFFSGSHHYSLWMVGFYLSCYLVAGILGGILNVKLVTQVQSGFAAKKIINQLADKNIADNNIFIATPKVRKNKKLFFILGVLMLVLLLVSYLPSFGDFIGIGKSKVAEILLRGLFIILLWNFFIKSILFHQMDLWVGKYKEKKGGSIQQIVELLPDIRKIVAQSWALSKQPNRFKQVKEFITNSVLLVSYNG